MGDRGQKITRNRTKLTSPLLAALALIAAGAYGLVRSASDEPSSADLQPAAMFEPVLDLEADRVLMSGRSPDLRAVGLPPAPARAHSGVPVDSPAGPRPRGLVTADFGGRGTPAIAVSDFMGDRVMIYEMGLDGANERVRVFRVPAGPRGLLAADFDSDGRMDLAVASAVAGSVTVFLGDGSGSFEAVSTLRTTEIPVELSMAPPSDGWVFEPRAGGGGERPGSVRADDPESGRRRSDHAALDVHCAGGVILRYRSLGGGLFDPEPERVERGAGYDEPTLVLVEPSPPASRDASSLGSGDVRTAPLFATPSIDFNRLRTCAAQLTMPAKKISAAAKKVTKAETALALAAAGTKAKKFSKSAKQLVAYINIINGEVGRSIDRAAADACIVPAQADIDAILLIGVISAVEIVAGEGQAARPFATLPIDLTVKVTDLYDNRFARIGVTFEVTSGLGTLTVGAASTNGDGEASTRLTLGGPPDGDVTVRAVAATAPPIPSVNFTEHKMTGTISLASDVQPVFTGQCAFSGCHDTSTQEEGMDLTAGSLFHPVTGIVSVASHQVTSLARVEPFDTEGSYLFHKVSGTHIATGGSGDRMPLGSNLSEPGRFLIETWIQQGAQDN